MHDFGFGESARRKIIKRSPLEKVDHRGQCHSPVVRFTLRRRTERGQGRTERSLSGKRNRARTQDRNATEQNNMRKGRTHDSTAALHANYKRVQAKTRRERVQADRVQAT